MASMSRFVAASAEGPCDRDLGIRTDSGQVIAQGIGFQPANVRWLGEGAAVERGVGHFIEVHQVQCADAAAGQVDRSVSPHSPKADDGDA